MSNTPVSKFMMKNFKSISSTSTIEDAAKIFYDENISSLMVLEDESFRGIITEKDLMASTLVFGHKKDTQVKNIMTASLVHVESNVSIMDAANIMIEKQIHKLPVMENGKIVGLISAIDLMILFSMIKEEDLLKIIGAQTGI
ncbi:MAG TPA: CBS domain-containing protein [Nitrosopumilus sp.]|nr:CBS domain-containing protein [Thermoproteota archaeon]HJJ23544.1 CBS domain-containing protein [Nitrosopumilus sp.]